MAEIAPFRGVRFNLERVPDLAQVVIPPYDVISPKEQELYYRTNAHSMIRLELGMTAPDDTPQNNAHTRAARYLQEWQKEGVLIRDERPSVYYYELSYSITPQLRQVRRGFICALRLADFSSGSVRPHEKTFQAIKDERLGLMLASRANLSPVFALYSDPSQMVDHALRTGREAAPVISFKDRQGMEHRIWRVTEAETLRQVKAMMMDKAVFIADGHHRYETALNYRSVQRERFNSAGPNASFEYIMMYLSNLNHGGLTILPTHRLLRNLGSWAPELFLEGAGEFFDVSSYLATEAGQSAWTSAMEAGRQEKEVLIGFTWQGSDSLYSLKAKRDAVSHYLEARGVPEALRKLDVVVLDQVVLRRLLALTESFLANENNIHFRHDLEESIQEVRSRRYEAGFLINPTRIEQVQEVASAGLIMPHKSTYFYPKVGSGLVINPLLPDEEISG